jgi:DNA-binding NtrC family response regulator
LNENILVVDDDAGVRKTLSSILLKEGYLVEAVENGKQAIRASEKEYFDVALVDIELPNMKGTELLLGLKKRQPEMIKIIITGFPSIENAMKAVNEGADGYVLKPFDVPKLLEMIRKHLDERANEHFRAWTEKSEMEQRGAQFSEQFKKTKGSIFTS